MTIRACPLATAAAPTQRAPAWVRVRVTFRVRVRIRVRISVRIRVRVRVRVRVQIGVRVTARAFLGMWPSARRACAHAHARIWLVIRASTSDTAFI